MITVHKGDNLRVLAAMPPGAFDLIYIDPPFNTGRTQARTRLRTSRDAAGDRTGFGGRRYSTTMLGSEQFADAFDDYLAFLEPRLLEAKRVLRATGSLFVHLDAREVHYVKVLLDGLFGRASFMNEIIWAYDYGGRGKTRWAQKHDTILWYVHDPERYTFRQSESDRLPYMAPGLVTPEKRARGKLPTDTWWNTIVSPTGKEKTGYPTQKPLGILRRIVRVHSAKDDTLLDFFAGSGSLGEAAALEGRDAVLIDESAQAIATMKKRFAKYDAQFKKSA